MSTKNTLSLDEVFEKDLQEKDFQRKDRLIKPFEDLIVEFINRRVELGLTQKELAQKAKTFQSRISKIESGEHNFSLKTIIQIAEALDSELIVRLVPFETRRAIDFTNRYFSQFPGEKNYKIPFSATINQTSAEVINFDTVDDRQLRLPSQFVRQNSLEDI